MMSSWRGAPPAAAPAAAGVGAAAAVGCCVNSRLLRLPLRFFTGALLLLSGGCRCDIVLLGRLDLGGGHLHRRDRRSLIISRNALRGVVRVVEGRLILLVGRRCISAVLQQVDGCLVVSSEAGAVEGGGAIAVGVVEHKLRKVGFHLSCCCIVVVGEHLIGHCILNEGHNGADNVNVSKATGDVQHRLQSLVDTNDIAEFAEDSGDAAGVAVSLDGGHGELEGVEVLLHALDLAVEDSLEDDLAWGVVLLWWHYFPSY